MTETIRQLVQRMIQEMDDYYVSPYRADGTELAYSDEVIVALEQREASIVTKLEEEGLRLGASRQDMDDVFIGVGLRQPPTAPSALPMPELSEQDRADIKSMLSQIEDQIAAIREKHKL